MFCILGGLQGTATGFQRMAPHEASGAIRS